MIQKLEQRVIDTDYGCGGASFSEVIDKVNEVIDFINSLRSRPKSSDNWKPCEEQDYSDLSDLERAIHRGFLCAGVENVPAAIIKETAKEAMAVLERTFECSPEKLPLWLQGKLGKKHLEGYIMGREETMREMRDFLKSHFNSEEAKGYNPPAINVQTWTPPCYNGGPCTNPQMDCINCPRKTTGGGFNTASGTSTATMHGNTSATDGKEHNPSFTD